MWASGGDRAVSPVIGVVMLVSIAVILASVVSVMAIGLGDQQQATAPKISISHELVDDNNGEQTVAITLESGDAVETEHLYVTGSVDLDIGGSPDSSEPADEAHASSREKFTESDGGAPQVGIGATWDAGETVYVDPVGSADGVTIRIYWSAAEVQGVNPGTVTDDDAYRIETFTV